MRYACAAIKPYTWPDFIFYFLQTANVGFNRGSKFARDLWRVATSGKKNPKAPANSKIIIKCPSFDFVSRGHCGG